MNNKKTIEVMGQVYKDIFKILRESKLKKSELVMALECAKFDIILNGGCIRLDGNEGTLYTKCKKIK